MVCGGRLLPIIKSEIRTRQIKSDRLSQHTLVNPVCQMSMAKLLYCMNGSEIMAN